MKIKTVETATAAYGGGLVDAIPVIAGDGLVAVPGGMLMAALETEEADDGVPVILVETATYETASGGLVNALPIVVEVV